MEKSNKRNGKWSQKVKQCDSNCCRLKICEICD